MSKSLPLLLVLAIAGVVGLAAFLNRPQPQPHRPPRPKPPPAPDEPRDLPHEHGPDCHPTLPEEELRKLPAGTVLVHATDAGRPVGAVPVVIFNAGFHIDRRGRTEDTGTCAFERVPVGEWTLYAKHPRFVQIVLPFTVTADQVTTVPVRLASGGSVAGAVTDESGAPVPGAGVSILDVQSKKLMHPSLRTQAGAQGEYLIEGIPLGPAGLLVHAPRFRPVDRYDLSFVRDGETLRLDIRLKMGTLVAGRVIDGTGLPLPGATVSASNEHTGITTTDPEGRFTISGLGDNPVSLFAQKKGFGTEYARGVPPNTATLEIRLLKSSTVSGRVAGDPPPPAFSVTFTRFEKDLGRWLRIIAWPIRESRAGAFAVPDVPAGHYKVEISADGWSSTEVEIVVHPGVDVAGLEIPARREPK